MMCFFFAQRDSLLNADEPQVDPLVRACVTEVKSMLQTAWIIMEAADRFRLPHSHSECVQSILRAPFLLIAIVELAIQIERCAEEGEVGKCLREIARELRLGIKLLGVEAEMVGIIQN
jgi:hypothetical protein